MAEGRFVISGDGAKIWADASGDPTKTPVVFVHGLSCTALAFEAQFADPTLLSNLYMVRYELRGHGRSDHPEDFKSYASIRYAEDFKAVCEAYKVVKPFICGWSMGALTVVDVTDAYGAEYFSGVILPGGPMITRALHRHYIQEDMKTKFPSYLSSNADVVAKAAVSFVESCVKDGATRIPFDVKMKWVGGFAMQSPTIRTHTCTRSQNVERWEKEIVNKPVMIIQGEDDMHSNTEKLIPVANRYMKNLELIVMKDVGHAPCFERAEETNAHILRFVQQVSGQK